MFVNRLGITSLYREAQKPPDSSGLGCIMHMYGGDPLGAFMQPHERMLEPSVSLALLMDMTHDNPCPLKTRTATDALPTAALVAMACCGSGSNRGYDELVTYRVHVVTEARLYRSTDERFQKDGGTIDCANTGIMKGKRALNRLHAHLGQNDYTQLFVDQKTADTVAVTRHNPQTHEKVVLVARTAFTDAAAGDPSTEPVVVDVGGVVDKVLFEMWQEEEGETKENKNYIEGLQHIKCAVHEDVE